MWLFSQKSMVVAIESCHNGVVGEVISLIRFTEAGEMRVLTSISGPYREPSGCPEEFAELAYLQTIFV